MWWIPCRVIILSSYQLQRNISTTTEINGFTSGSLFVFYKYLFVKRYCNCSETELSQLIPAGTILCHSSTGHIVVFSFNIVSVVFVLNSYTPYWSPYVTFITSIFVQSFGFTRVSKKKKKYWHFCNSVVCHILLVRFNAANTTTGHWRRYRVSCIHLSSVQSNTLLILKIIPIIFVVILCYGLSLLFILFVLVTVIFCL